MPPYNVQLLLGFEQRPTRKHQALLGAVNARVQPWGMADLQVSLDVEAPDMVTALSRAKELVVDRLAGELLTAQVAAPDYGARPGSWWQRWRRHRRMLDP